MGAQLAALIIQLILFVFHAVEAYLSPRLLVSIEIPSSPSYRNLGAKVREYLTRCAPHTSWIEYLLVVASEDSAREARDTHMPERSEH